MIVRRSRLLIPICLAVADISTAAGAQQARRLYPGTAPGSETWVLPEVARPIPGGSAYTNVRDPELITYLPATPPNGTAAILLPGGGLRGLSIGTENGELIGLLTHRGVTVFVLKYRTLQIEPPSPGGQSAGPMKFPKLVIRNANANPSPNDAGLNDVLKLAVRDAQTAMRMVRADAAKLRINPARIGLIGSSAGGGVAIGALLAHQSEATPAFIVSLYGPALQDVVVPADAPPLFIATETGHGPVTDGLLALFAMWKDAGAPAELHVYDVPNFAMPVALYEARLAAFLGKHGFLPPAADRR
jgi:dienelactone hydrolase